MDFGEPFGGLIPGARGAVLGVVLRTDTPLTGRQIHALLSDRHSLWSVQQNLKDLTRLGLITSHTIGRSGMHTINEHHVAVAGRLLGRTPRR
jgi:Fe2+ or Zn2+ uptake regulation protein